MAANLNYVPDAVTITSVHWMMYNACFDLTDAQIIDLFQKSGKLRAIVAEDYSDLTEPTTWDTDQMEQMLQEFAVHILDLPGWPNNGERARATESACIFDQTMRDRIADGTVIDEGWLEHADD